MQLSYFQSSFPIKISAIKPLARKYWLDILLISILSIGVAFASYQGAKLINPLILQTYNVWFDVDSPRVFANMTVRRSDHYRVKVHPLFSLIAFLPTSLLIKILDIQPITAVRLVIAAVAALWMASLFVLLRIIGCYRLDAMLFSLVAATSASAMFFFVIPETHSFGALSFMIALCFVAITQHRKLSQWWYVGISTLTLSFTTTNWMTGILATLVNHRWKRALQITANVFSLVVVLWTVQKIIFPTAVFFLGDREEKDYLLKPESGGPLQCIKSFLFHSMVMPAIGLGKNLDQPGYPMMITQQSLPGSGSVWGVVAVFLWAGLLALGLWALFSLKVHLKLRIVLGLTLLGQLAIHSVLYTETFLYSLHFGPLLVVLAALSSLLKPARLIALVLAGTLILTAGVNNILQFNKATALFASFAPERLQVMGEMQKRPDDLWPRGKAHIVLATPGTQEVDKAYHEPGGSFSPSVGSFGVSLWVTDQSGNIQATSDTIPLKEIQQKLIGTERQYIPAILTDTSNYRILWSSAGPERWTANIQPKKDNKNTKKMVVIRSVGPAGGPIRSMDWNGKRLLINDRWSVTLSPAPVKVYLGEEGRPGWKTETASITQWKGSNGWGYARLELADTAETNLVIEDSNIASAIPLNLPKALSTPEINLPEKEFTDSVHAQVAHLMMSLVNQQTRPGEPTNYPLPWLRDGSYVVVALARAGELDVAKQLATYFAENDFFGGFGPEADAPGLSIRAVTEVADQVNQPDYDRWLWPHVRRKADFILEMLSTKQPIYRSITGPIVPIHKDKPDLALVAEPAKNGLIVGRMDWHRPILYVNAVSYRGLLDAASLADRVNQPADAERWRQAAAKLKQAWEAGFKPPESENERTYMSSLWPTWIATDSHKVLQQGLEKRWTQLRDAQGGFRDTPLWTYFDIAEAHQWLFLNNQERLWKTLRWFWNNQTSPGLYTWWEGHGEENTFNRWEKIRGWVKPAHVTPNYWTASEMLLLQLDMLAYTDLSVKQPTVVIGAGIPAEWLTKPMSVKGLAMANGKLDWNWNGKQMDVKIRGEKMNVRLGGAFPPNTPLKVEYLKS